MKTVHALHVCNKEMRVCCSRSFLSSSSTSSWRICLKALYLLEACVISVLKNSIIACIVVYMVEVLYLTIFMILTKLWTRILNYEHTCICSHVLVICVDMFNDILYRSILHVFLIYSHE